MHETFYKSLYLIRKVEQEVARVYPTDCIKSPVHLSIGQEAVAVGICQGLQPSDAVFGTYRSHALYLAKGGDLKKMIAELYGKATGCSRGKGGSMHLADAAAGVMVTSAVVASTIPQAVGYALALRMRKSNSVVACFFGDGAVEEGVFHESLNFAALKQLPVLLVCENNQYAIHSRLQARQASTDICGKALAQGVPAQRVGEDDVFAIHRAATEALKDIRDGKGPRLLECLTYRWMEHVGPNEDYQAGYRSRTELEPWAQRDAVAAVGAMLKEPVRKAIEADVDQLIREAFAFATSSPFPADTELYTDVFRES